MSFDPRVLDAFFQEVQDSLHLDLIYDPNNEAFPIQLSSTEGISRDKSHELLHFIKAQVDLRDNEICKTHPKGSRIIIEISKKAAQALAEVYALSFFYDMDTEEEGEENKGGTHKKK